MLIFASDQRPSLKKCVKNVEPTVMLQPYVYLVEKQRNEPFQTWMDGLTLDNTPLLLYAQEHTQFNGILLPTWAWPLSRGIKIQNHDTKRQFLEYFSMLTQSFKMSFPLIRL